MVRHSSSFIVETAHFYPFCLRSRYFADCVTVNFSKQQLCGSVWESSNAWLFNPDWWIRLLLKDLKKKKAGFLSFSTAQQWTQPSKAWELCTVARANWRPQKHWRSAPASHANRCNRNPLDVWITAFRLVIWALFRDFSVKRADLFNRHSSYDLLAHKLCAKVI